MARKYAVISPGAKAVPRRWSTFTHSGVVGGNSCRTERSASLPRSPTTCAHSCRFAGKVPGIELGDSCVEVVRIEHDPGCHQTVGVDFGDLQRFHAERSGPLGTFCEPYVAEAETITSQGERGMS